MKKFNLNLLLLLTALVMVIMQLRSCLASQNSSAVALQNTNVYVQATYDVGDSKNLDLEAVGLLLSKAKDAEEFERLLNQEGGVNNLDLNQDGKVDFIKVTEQSSNDQRGFSLSTELESGTEQEIAQISIQSESGEQAGGERQADVQIQGNESLYGANHYYHSRMGFGDVFLLAWLFSPHRPYYSPFAWNYYPSYYGRGYAPIAQSSYLNRSSALKQNRTSGNFQRRDKPQFQSQFKSQTTPTAQGKSTTQTKRSSLSNPTKSQRSFQKRTTSLNSVRSSSAFRSGSSFGGGK